MFHELFAKCVMVLASGIALTACSNSPYSKHIDRFASSASSLNSSFIKLQNRERAAVEDVRLSGYMSEGLQLIFFIDGACNKLDNIATISEVSAINSALQGAKDCNLKYTVTGENGRVEGPFALRQEMSSGLNSLLLSTEIEKYARSLREITSSESEAELNAALSDFSDSLASFSKAVEGTSGTGTESSFADNPSAILSLFNRITLSYMNYRRNVALREAVAAANPLIERAALVLGEQAIYANAAAAQVDYVLARSAIERGFVADSLSFYDQKEQLISAVATLRAHGRADPQEAYRSLVTAHGQLNTVLGENSSQIENVIASLAEFEQQVRAVAALLEPEE